MTPAERKFKRAVRTSLQVGEYPGCFALVSRGVPVGKNGFNGRQCRWREEVMNPWLEEHPDDPITIKRKKLRHAATNAR